MEAPGARHAVVVHGIRGLRGTLPPNTPGEIGEAQLRAFFEQDGAPCAAVGAGGAPRGVAAS